jgi:predicted choloylglycine hydrolase
MEQLKLPYFHVKGSNYEIGFQIGKEFKNKITNTITNRDKFFDLKKWDTSDNSRINVMLKLSKKIFPDFIEEMQGIADGAGYDFRDIFIHNSMHLLDLANCSTGVFKLPNKILIAHNEDFDPIMEKNRYFLFVEQENKTSFFAHSYPGVIPGMSFGFNSAGLLMTCNFLPDPTKSLGISRILFGRSILEQSSIKKGLKIIDSFNPRTGGASYTLASLKENKVINVETTGLESTIIEISDRFFRANHYISKEFQDFPIHCKDTLVRQKGGDKKILEVEKTIDGILDVLWDETVFLDMKDTNNRYQTNCTIQLEISDDIYMKYYRRDTRYEKYFSIKLSDLR